MQQELHSLRPEDTEKCRELQRLNSFADMEWQTVQETRPEGADQTKTQQFIAGAQLLLSKWSQGLTK